MEVSKSQLTPEELQQLKSNGGRISVSNASNHSTCCQSAKQTDKASSSVDASSSNNDPSKASLDAPSTAIADIPTNFSIIEEDDQPLYGEYQKLNFDDPIDVLTYYVPEINNGTVVLHKWQAEVNIFIAQQKADKKHPLKYCLCANNGSGKDSFIIAPLAIWFCLTRIKGRVILTSSSGTQLSGQTEVYIRDLCEKINKSHGARIFKINQRYIKCLLTGSEIRMFATDEAGKAEGWHPIGPNTEMMLLVNECKSVDDEIYKAVKRCTGYSYLILVSSPGDTIGFFYNTFKNLPDKLKRRVTYQECPHMSEDDRLDDLQELGENSAYYRSKWLALFTSIDKQVVVTKEALDKCFKVCTEWRYQHWPKRVGIDLAAGGDECVLVIWQGNKRIYQKTWREKDTTISADIIHRELNDQGISQQSEYIRADDGGIGRGIIDNLVRKGWTITRVLNQSAARNKREFGNRGAEMYFRFKRLIEECFLLRPVKSDGTPDTEFEDQLTSRLFVQSKSLGRTILQSKKEAKAEGYKSPDRADASVLALCDLKVEDFFGEDKSGDGTSKPGTSKDKSLVHSLEELMRQNDKHKFEHFNNPRDRSQFANNYLIDGQFTEAKEQSNIPSSGLLNNSLDQLLSN